MNRFLSKSARLDPSRTSANTPRPSRPWPRRNDPCATGRVDARARRYAKGHPGNSPRHFGDRHDASSRRRIDPPLTGIDWVHVPTKAGAGDHRSHRRRDPVGFSILATAAPFLASERFGSRGERREALSRHPNVATVASNCRATKRPRPGAATSGRRMRDLCCSPADEIVRILNSPEVRAKPRTSASGGYEHADELLATIRRDIEYTPRIVKAVGISRNAMRES